jgi:signal transduction histidine kinase
MKQQTAELRTETTEAVEAVRQMAFDMRPGTLDDLGVVTALRRDVENIARSAGFHAVFRVYDEDRLRLSSDAEVALYRVVNAALTNIVQHARTSNVSVILQPQDTDALVMVEDDGVGFDTEAAMAGPVEARFGLLGMQERMASVGGRVNVESTPGEGTATFITLPLEPEG